MIVRGQAEEMWLQAKAEAQKLSGDELVYDVTVRFYNRELSAEATCR
jgi:hypothetical protein